MFLFKNQKIPKTYSKFKKNQKKSISNFKKFLTNRFLRCNIYQISNNNINYVPKANLPKQNHSSWLFIQKNSKKTKKKVKTQKHKNNSRIVIRLLSHFFSYEQNCLLHSSNFYFFCQYLFHILTMMYKIFFDATEVKTNIQCK
jgi:hypothetical protein